MLDRMRGEGFPRGEQPRTSKKVYDTPWGERVEINVEHVPILRGSDISDEDRVMVETRSGNRYMFRRSKNADGAIKVYNERESGLNEGHLIHRDSVHNGVLAEVGKHIRLVIASNDKEHRRIPWESTGVTDIQIRRGAEKVVDYLHDKTKEMAEKGSGGGFGRLVQALTAEISWAKSPGEEPGAVADKILRGERD